MNVDFDYQKIKERVESLLIENGFIIHDIYDHESFPLIKDFIASSHPKDDSEANIAALLFNKIREKISKFIKTPDTTSIRIVNIEYDDQFRGCGSYVEFEFWGNLKNVQDEPTAESPQAGGANAGFEPQAGSGSAPSPCSAGLASDKHLQIDPIKHKQEMENAYQKTIELMRLKGFWNRIKMSLLCLFGKRMVAYHMSRDTASAMKSLVRRCQDRQRA